MKFAIFRIDTINLKKAIDFICW